MTRRAWIGACAWLLASLSTPVALEAQDAGLADVDATLVDAGEMRDAATTDASAATTDASAATTDASAATTSGVGAGPTPADDSPALPADHQPRLTTTLTPTEGLITGDALTLEIRAEVPAEDDVAVPEQSFAPFDILRSNISSVVSRPAMILSSLLLVRDCFVGCRFRAPLFVVATRGSMSLF